MSGLTPEGLERDSVATIKARIEAKLRANISATFDVSPESPMGQVIGVFVQELGIVLEAIEAAYDAFDPDKAEDFLMVALAKLTGTFKRAATQSRVLCSVNLDEDTVLLAGTHFAHVAGRPLSRFTPEEDFTAPSDGVHGVWFVSEEAGPIAAPATTLTVMATPLVGWNSVTNATDATLGLVADTTETLRARREQELQSSGNATLDAIESKVSKVSGVQSVSAFENTTNAEDENGVPAHAIEVLVFDGVTPTADNDEIAQAIWDARAGGIRSFGDVSGTAVDKMGRDRTMYFSRVTAVQVHVEIDVDYTTDYVTDPVLATYFVEQANALQAVGQSVKVRRVDSLVYELAGVVDVTGFRLGFATSPVGTSNLAIGFREIAYFDSVNVLVASAEAP